MYISQENPKEIKRRLLKVIANTEIKYYEDPYAFKEIPLSDFPEKIDKKALAFVCDDEVCSQLVPSNATAKESFLIFRLHFRPNYDNSGFVGWLATYFKQKIGTGVFVTCGQNSNKGGIFDYWGCPYEVGKEVLEELKLLIEKGNELRSL